MENWDVVIEPRMLATIVDRAAQRGAEVHLLEGQFGAGTTTLAEAAASRLRELGITVLTAYASEQLNGVPLAAMAPVLATVHAAPEATVADRLQRLYRSLATARVAPVLVVDDAAHLDEVSAAAVRQLVRSYGVRCIITARTGAALPEPLARLDDEGLLRRTMVPPLSSSAAASLVERALGERVETDSLHRIVTRAGGSPQLLRGLVRSAVDSGLVGPSPAGAVIPNVALPVRLADGIAERYKVLGAEPRRLAELLAVSGRLPTAVLDDRQAVAALDALSVAGLTSVDDDGAVGIGHPVHAETLLARLDDTRVDELRILAGALLERSKSDDDRFAAAVVLTRSSSPPPTPEVVWAARRASALDRRDVAVDLAGRAIRLAEQRGEAAPSGALLVRADSLSMQGRLAEADDAFAEALLAEAQDDDHAVIALRAGLHYAVRRRLPERADEIWQAAFARIDDPVARAQLATNISKWQLMVGETPLTNATLPEADTDPAFAMHSRLLQILATVSAGDVVQARAAIDAGRPLAEALKNETPNVTEVIDFAEFVLIMLEGRLVGALAFADSVQHAPLDEAAGLWSYGRAFVLAQAGRLDEALRLATLAVTQLEWRDIVGLHGAAVGLRASVAAQLGQHAFAAEVLSGLPVEARRVVTADLQVVEAEAWLLLADGDESGAVEAVAASALAGALAANLSFAGIVVSTATRLGHPSPAIELARAVDPAPVPPAVRMLTDHAEALAARDPGALLVASAALESSGFAVAAHSAAVQAAELARAAGATNFARRAEAARSRIATGFSPLPSSHGPESLLSQRELAVARLAAGRQRNREIAETLGLSQRTVENHLANAYRKLGVVGRDELRDLLATGL